MNGAMAVPPGMTSKPGSSKIISIMPRYIIFANLSEIMLIIKMLKPLLKAVHLLGHICVKSAKIIFICIYRLIAETSGWRLDFFCVFYVTAYWVCRNIVGIVIKLLYCRTRILCEFFKNVF